MVEKLIGQFNLKKQNLTDKIFASDIRLLESDWHIPFSHDYYAENKQEVETFWQNIVKVRAKVIASYTEN